VRHFKLSQDPAFAAKLRDGVGLYLDPPVHSLVLSVDEKSQIQALDRTQPSNASVSRGANDGAADAAASISDHRISCSLLIVPLPARTPPG
jgi:hypothetical protein